MTAQPAEPGLRERKRMATQRSIQLAVLRLTAENGLDQVTVEEISRVAGVSPRTFFNYFPTKEASLVGEMPFTLPEGVADRFEHVGPSGDVLRELVEILAEQAGLDGALDPELHVLRRAVMRDNPQIFALRVDRMREFETVLGESVARRLVRDAELRGEPVDEAEFAEQARLIALLVLTMARAAWLAWSEHPAAAPLPELLRLNHRRLQHLVVPPEPA